MVQKLQRGLMLSLVILATHQYVDSNGRGRQLLPSSNLERMRAEKVIQTRSVAANAANSQGQTTSSRKTSVPWK